MLINEAVMLWVESYTAFRQHNHIAITISSVCLDMVDATNLEARVIEMVEEPYTSGMLIIGIAYT